MATLRVRATVETDGEIQLRGLPIRKGDVADVIVLIKDDDDGAVLAALQADPAWAWLKDDAEDVYTEQDVR